MGIAVIKELENLDVVISEVLEFDIKDKNKYLKDFEECIAKGLLREGTKFDDSTWSRKYGGVESSIIFPNEIQYKKLSKMFDREFTEFILAYKVFILYQLNFEAIRKFNLLIRRIADGSEEVGTREIGMFNEFIQYIKVPYENLEYFEMFIKEDKNDKNERILPQFLDVFKFTDIINDIVQNKNIIDYKGYLLTIMWWKICSIVPLRPSEFLRIKFSCIGMDKKGDYYLKVMRTKMKGARKIRFNVQEIDECYYEDEVVIDQSLYNFILDYQDILKSSFGYTEEKELFPINIICKADNYSKRSERRRMNKELIIYDDLRANLRKFYEDIVSKEYGLIPIPKYIKKDGNEKYIEKLTLHDARHIAIINLVLLGVDVFEVMHLAGHSSVNTTVGYYQHVEIFAKGYALAYATFDKKNEQASRKDKERKDEKEYKIISDKYLTETIDFIEGNIFKSHKVKGGYCSYKSIGNDKSICHTYDRNHTICPYFKADNKAVFQEQLDKVEKVLDVDIKVLKDLIRDMDGISKFNELYQTTSSRISNSIAELAILNKNILE